MKIAITADLHLKTNQIERFGAFFNILQNIKKRNIKELIIAGDLFDKETNDFTEFEKICSKFKDINIFIIPGNHDEKIEQRFFTEKNIKIINEITMIKFENLIFLFVPYKRSSSMDEEITKFFMHNETYPQWILIGHGNYLTSKREYNPYEPDFYMTLTSHLVNKFRPELVILGHIHKPESYGKVFYTGSPVSIDKTETGKRRFLIIDTEKKDLESVYVETDFINFSENLLVIPINEIERVKMKIDNMIKNWRIDEEDLGKVRLRLIVTGYSYERDKLKSEIIKYLSSKNIRLNEEEIKFNVKVAREDVRFYLLDRFLKVVEDTDIYSYAGKDEIIKAGMETIFEEQDGNKNQKS